MKIITHEKYIEYGISIEVEVQPTHCYDFNAPDALGHSCIKRFLRSRKIPRHTGHLVRDFDLAVERALTDRAIQRSFMRAYSKNADGDVDETLIPQEIQDWYSDSDYSDEERSSDLQWWVKKNNHFNTPLIFPKFLS